MNRVLCLLMTCVVSCASVPVPTSEKSLFLPVTEVSPAAIEVAANAAGVSSRRFLQTVCARAEPHPLRVSGFIDHSAMNLYTPAFCISMRHF
jgi:hypothetical protein